jgi:alpha-glucosidase
MIAAASRHKLAGGHAQFLFAESDLELTQEEAKQLFEMHDDSGGAFRIAFKEDARFFGLGACAETADRVGGPFRMVTVDTQVYRLRGATYSSFPVLWARFKSTSHVAAFALASSFPYEVRCTDKLVTFKPLADLEGEGTDLVVLVGEPHAVSLGLARLTGMPAMPPAWALGYHQSRWSYKTQAEVLRVADSIRAHGLPADAIHLDIHYMQDYRVFTWHQQRFADPVALHQALAARKLRTVAIVDPGVAQQEHDETYRELAAKNYFLTTSKGAPYVGKVWPGRSLFPDFLRSEVRECWADRHKVLLDAGVSGIWNDMNEPTLHNTRYIEPTTTGLRHHASSHTRVRNLYANHMAQAAFEGQHKANPDRRPFVLTRSGFLGVQRYAAVWTGDNFTHWQQLRANLYMVLNIGLSGVPMAGADVGGFGSRRGPLGLLKFRRPAKELFVRWMELGSFMPFFRGHTTQYSPAQEPWAFGQDTLALCKTQLERRYRLMPTLYSLALEASTQGTPIVRPSWYHGDAFEGGAPDDAFFFGPEVLVYPTLEPGAKHLDVHLPQGTFVDAETLEEVSGKVRAETPLGTVAHFVRGNAVLFVAEGATCAADTLKGPVYIDVYRTSEVSTKKAHLLLDDGETERESPKYRAMEAALTHTATETESVLEFVWVRDDLEAPPALVLRMKGEHSEVMVDGVAVKYAREHRGLRRSVWTVVRLAQPPKHVVFKHA